MHIVFFPLTSVNVTVRKGHLALTVHLSVFPLTSINVTVRKGILALTVGQFVFPLTSVNGTVKIGHLALTMLLSLNIIALVEVFILFFSFKVACFFKVFPFSVGQVVFKLTLELLLRLVDLYFLILTSFLKSLEQLF